MTVLAGQMSLFAGLPAPQEPQRSASPVDKVPVRKQLEMEKEPLGVYITDHPLDAKMTLLSSLVTHWALDLEPTPQIEVVIVAGEVLRQRILTTKNGDEMAFAALEDHQGPIELVLFPKTWAAVRPWFEQEKIVVARRRVDHERGEPKVLEYKITDQIERVRVISNRSS